MEFVPALTKPKVYREDVSDSLGAAYFLTTGMHPRKTGGIYFSNGSSPFMPVRILEILSSSLSSAMWSVTFEIPTGNNVIALQGTMSLKWGRYLLVNQTSYLEMSIRGHDASTFGYSLTFNEREDALLTTEAGGTLLITTTLREHELRVYVNGQHRVTSHVSQIENGGLAFTYADADGTEHQVMVLENVAAIDNTKVHMETPGHFHYAYSEDGSSVDITAR